MHLAKIEIKSGIRVARVDGERVEPIDLRPAGLASLDELLSHPDLVSLASNLPADGSAISVSETCWLPPIDRQEVWAAGVTYKRSQTARMEESEAAKDCYSRVYESARPEIFFKATPSRCTGHLGKLRIRVDATWNVPEPELALVLSSKMQIVGYTVGNDMSSRDIEGENPLYLPQAKMYDQCCGLGPWITLAQDMPERSKISIQLAIWRDNQVVFSGETSVSQMARQFEELVGWLGRDNTLPYGGFLLTGTGIVPNSDFTLLPGDWVDIDIDGVGKLRSLVVQGPAAVA